MAMTMRLCQIVFMHKAAGIAGYAGNAFKIVCRLKQHEKRHYLVTSVNFLRSCEDNLLFFEVGS